MSVRRHPAVGPTGAAGATGPTGPQGTPPAGTPVLRGPYVVNYTDIPHDGDTLVLWTPAVGDVLLMLFGDAETYLPFDHGNLFVGQLVDGTLNPPHNMVGFVGSFSTDAAGDGVLTTLDMGYQGQFYDATGTARSATVKVFHSADPIQIQQALKGGPAPTQGHLALYALIARAVAP